MYDGYGHLKLKRKQMEVVIKKLPVSEVDFMTLLPPESNECKDFDDDIWDFRISFFKQLCDKCPTLVITSNMHKQLTLMHWQHLVCLPIMWICACSGMLDSDESDEFAEYCSLVSSIQPRPQYILQQEFPGITPEQLYA